VGILGTKGTIQSGSYVIELKKFFPSVGLGMRFFLPMFGLLGFDYGIGLDRINGNTGLKGAAKFTFMLGQEPE
jgi:outer membrane protein assembly factor BamA